MKNTVLLLTPLLALAAGCSTNQPSTMIASADLPNCFASNYSEQYKLFTVVNPTAKSVNQQCLLPVLPSGNNSSGQQLIAGNYLVGVSNGGGGGAGGTMQSGTKFPGRDNSGGGGGGGGAGAVETKATVNLTEGTYRLTIGVGGPGGMACSGPPDNFPGGPGWGGSPTNIVRIATGEVILGQPGAETYARLSRAQHERATGKPDGTGGHGPGLISGGDGATFNTAGNIVHPATAGSDKPSPSIPVAGGNAGMVLPKAPLAGPGGGGGASSVAVGGTGGGDLPKKVEVAPTRGTLGSGGGGGAGDSGGCSAGAPGGHGFIDFVRI